VAGDPNITKRVPTQAVERAFDLKRQLRNIDGIFAQVFNRKKGGKMGDMKTKTSRVTRTGRPASRRARSKAS
jgi:hypothetical protein